MYLLSRIFSLHVPEYRIDEIANSRGRKGNKRELAQPVTIWSSKALMAFSVSTAKNVGGLILKNVTNAVKVSPDFAKNNFIIYKIRYLAIFGQSYKRDEIIEQEGGGGQLAHPNSMKTMYKSRAVLRASIYDDDHCRFCSFRTKSTDVVYDKRSLTVCIRGLSENEQVKIDSFSFDRFCSETKKYPSSKC